MGGPASPFAGLPASSPPSFGVAVKPRDYRKNARIAAKQLKPSCH
jgi:hypothetical protein